jgi:hypothetical protein
MIDSGPHGPGQHGPKEKKRPGPLVLSSGRNGDQVEKEEPQPQVVVAFGLRITNCAPCKPSE